jgi:hypothetical protein
MPAWQTVIAAAAGIFLAVEPYVRILRRFARLAPPEPLTPREPDLRAVPYRDR